MTKHTAQPRFTLLSCEHCGQLARGPHGTHTCLDCIEDIREQHRCPDCDSIVTVALLTEDEQGIARVWADVAHDETCPSWRALKSEG